MEELYKPAVGDYLKIEFLKESLKKIEEETHKSFEKNFGKKGYQYGTNQLAFRVVQDYVRRFLNQEIQFLKDNPSERPHGMALSYASKKVKDLKSKHETAVKLWA